MIDPKKPLGTSYVLSESDRDKFLALWREYSHLLPRPKPDRGHFPDHEEHQAPEVYIARTPPTGIPGLDELNTGTLLDDSPGEAECDIYQVIPLDTGRVLRPTSGNRQMVLNLSTSLVPGDSWILVARDKYGQWFVTGVVGESPTSGTGTGTGTGPSNLTVYRYTCIDGTLYEETIDYRAYIPNATGTADDEEVVFEEV